MGTNKNLCIAAIRGAMSTVNVKDVNFVGPDGHHLVSFCVRFCDRNHLVDRIYKEDRTGLIRVRLTVRRDRSTSFEVYAAELPLDALETLVCVTDDVDLLEAIANGTLEAPAPAAAPDADEDPADEDADESEE